MGSGRRMGFDGCLWKGRRGKVGRVVGVGEGVEGVMRKGRWSDVSWWWMVGWGSMVCVMGCVRWEGDLW